VFCYSSIIAVVILSGFLERRILFWNFSDPSLRQIRATHPHLFHWAKGITYWPNRDGLSLATPMAGKECTDGDSGFCCQLCRRGGGQEGVWPLYFIFGQNGKHLAHRRRPTILYRPAVLFSPLSASLCVRTTCEKKERERERERASAR